VLRATYWKGTTNEECVRELARWAREHGIEVEMERHGMMIGNHPGPDAYTVRFKPKPR
jgi:hypothetical protein